MTVLLIVIAVAVLSFAVRAIRNRASRGPRVPSAAAVERAAKRQETLNAHARKHEDRQAEAAAHKAEREAAGKYTGSNPLAAFKSGWKNGPTK
jgi:hypothetical protein